jgi:hypothetical protein
VLSNLLIYLVSFVCEVRERGGGGGRDLSCAEWQNIYIRGLLWQGRIEIHWSGVYKVTKNSHTYL